ncbi:MAG: hypothetical protein BMS9Abin30_0257 [Gammaproteobacteria bacterium]|nr:MAG: hypothetical protein BMS9Abin30_0257 [Gammaproteobacteria bacterium]
MGIISVPLVDYATAYGQATALGVREVSVSLDWALFEPTTVGVYTDSFGRLATSLSFYAHWTHPARAYPPTLRAWRLMIHK